MTNYSCDKSYSFLKLIKNILILNLIIKFIIFIYILLDFSGVYFKLYFIKTTD